MRDDAIGCILITLVVAILVVLALCITVGAVAYTGDEIGLWNLPDDTCHQEVAR